MSVFQLQEFASDEIECIVEENGGLNADCNVIVRGGFCHSNGRVTIKLHQSKNIHKYEIFLKQV